MRFVFAFVAILVCLLVAHVECRCQFLDAQMPAPQAQGGYLSLGFKRFVNSFTSYQFPSPFPPGQDPLSRLEFPIDQWFVGATGGFAGRYCSMKSQLWINANRDSALKMQDSDWDDESDPFQKTIFSESNCRLNRGLLVDIGASVATPVSTIANLRPVFGFRYQYFYFTTHDGFQAAVSGGSSELHGDGIDFKQAFYHWYLGAGFRTGFNLGIIAGTRWPVTLDSQLDFGLVTARNEDLHLLRAGDRVTEEKTRGHCWHLCVSMDILMRDYLRASIEADFKRLVTDGSHRLTNPLFNIDFSFDGSRVWSDQASVSAVGTLVF